MPSGTEIQQYLIGAWRLMLGHGDGLKLLDLSVDGFWNSFFAIVLALPAFFVSWAGVANQLGAQPEVYGSPLSIVARLAVVDLGAWVLPLVVLAFVAPRVGIGDRFVHYVVASNWGSVLMVWIMLPATLLRLVAPGLEGIVAGLSLLLFALTMVLSWRLTNASLNKGQAVATGLFAAMFVVSLLALFALQSLLGLGEAAA